MDKNVKMQIAKIRSLMERTDSHLTGFQALLNEEKLVNEAVEGRTEYNDIIELLWNKNFGSAKFVSLGYVINATTPSNVYPSEENSAALDDIIANSNGAEWGKKLQSVKDNDKWGKIMSGKSKSSAFRGGGLSVIAVVPYTIQWQNGEKFNKWYNERKKGEDAIAQKWGISPMEVMQNSEAGKQAMAGRIAYSGKFKNGEQPIFGGRIGDEIQRYNDGSEKLALKHVKQFVHKGTPQYFYLNEAGQYEPISHDVMSFLTFKLGGKKAKEALENVEEEAQSYEEELKRYKADTSKFIQQFVLRQVGYIAATVKDEDSGDKESVAYVNPHVDASESSNGFEVNQQALYKELQRMARVAKDDTEESAEQAM